MTDIHFKLNTGASIPALGLGKLSLFMLLDAILTPCRHMAES